jgi:hypothetical protein
LLTTTDGASAPPAKPNDADAAEATTRLITAAIKDDAQTAHRRELILGM